MTGTYRLRADLSLGLVALIWGATFVVVKQALETTSTLLFLTLRFGVAAAALALAFRWRLGSLRVRRQEWRGGVVTGLFLFAGYVLQTGGLRFTTPAKSAFVTGLYIPLVPLIGSLVYKKWLHPSEALGVVLASVGMALLTVDPETLRIGGGDLLTLGCAFAFAVHILMVGRYSRSIGVEMFSLLQIATAALLSAGAFWWVETPRVTWGVSLWVAVAATGLLATALAFTMQVWAQQHTTPTRTALIFSLEPVFAWLTSLTVAGEVLSLKAATGAGLILAGILLVELKPVGRQEHPCKQQAGEPGWAAGSETAGSGRDTEG